MTDRPADLPAECWESIFNWLDHHRRLEPISLVCKTFLSISNHLRHTLTVSDPTLSYLPHLLRRFPNLKKIQLPELYGDPNSLLYQISVSGLDLQSLDISKHKSFPLMGVRFLGRQLQNLKELNCSKTCLSGDRDLIEIGTAFPFLEVLDISYPEPASVRTSDPSGLTGVVTDDGVLSLSSRLPRLRKVDLSGNQLLTDKALLSLASNCLLLSEISIVDCVLMTQNGIGLAIRNAANLKYMSVDRIGIPSIDRRFVDSFAFSRGFRELDLSNSFISDEFLYSLAEARLPLRKLVLCHCYCFTIDGLSFLLSKYRTLVHLELEGASFLTDVSMMDLTKFLGELTHINLGLCSLLTDWSFFDIARNCSLINVIKMERTNFGLEVFPAETVVNPRIKSLYLAGNNMMNDECLKKIACTCPNLEVLDISYCPIITEEGITAVLRQCRRIMYLDVNRCGGIKNLEIDFELPNLEKLQARGVGIDDEVLRTIGKRCSGLLFLDLEGCLHLTARGVKEMVANCRLLKEINLRWCDSLAFDDIAWMVFSRPSLRKIRVPNDFVPTENQKNFLLQHGCLVCQD